MIRGRVRPLYRACMGMVLLALAGPAEGQVRAPVPDDALEHLRFRAIGPATASGRIDDFAVYEANPSIFYVGVATGNLWKTVNNGVTWEVLFADQPDTVSIGDIAIGHEDPDLVWVGTGENNNRQSSSWGNGVYKSTDGGRTWQHMGLTESRHIGRILIDPRNYDIVYVAATGALWGANEERGVFKTTDGGLTWEKVLYVDEDTGATDLLMDPTKPAVLYAATYQRRRAAWGFHGGGPGSGIYKSVDAGKSWRKLDRGLPGGVVGRIGLDIYRSNPRVLYARVQHETDGGIFRTDDGGESWRKMSDLNPRPMYFGQIRIDPNDDSRIYLLGISFHMSDDGGRTWINERSAVQDGLWPPGNPINASIHTDHHALWINPRNSDHLILGTDGGVYASYDRGRTWDFFDNMDLGQFYHVGFDMDVPYRVYGGLQDNLSWGGPSATRSYLGISNNDWFLIGGGDGFVSFADPTDSRIIYTESQNGRIVRVDRLTNERKQIRPEPATGEEPYRWNWDTPFILSPHDPKTLIIGAHRLFRTRDRGDSWEAISPDLTSSVDRETLSLMGVQAQNFTIAKHDGVSMFPTLTTVAESPVTEGVYYAGADDGTVHVSRDGGKTWENITTRFPGLPEGTWVSRLAASRFSAGVVYASFDGHRSNDYEPHVYGSSDAGRTWTKITSGIPAGHAVRTIVEDLKNGNVLYVGTEFGLFVSLDRGASWRRLKSNLPTVPIYGIALHPRENDMILATHGRSIWILDDLTPIQQASEAVASEAFLFDVRSSLQINRAFDRWWMAGDRKFWGHNPPAGAPVGYWLRSQAETVVLRIQDAAGTVVRELSGDELPHAEGMHRVQWDLRYAPVRAAASGSAPAESSPWMLGADQVPSHMFQDIHRIEIDPLAAPFVFPGEYRVTLLVNGKEAGTRAVRVQPDPDIEISEADRRLYHDTAVGLYRLQLTAMEAGGRVAELSDRFDVLKALVASAGTVPPDVSTAVGTFEARLTELQRHLGVRVTASPFGGLPGLPGQIAGQKGQVMASTSRPTQVQLRARGELEQELDSLVEAVNEAISQGFPELQKLVVSRGIRPALPALVGPPGGSR